MSGLLTSLLALTAADHPPASDPKAPPAVLPAVVYRDIVFTHYPAPRLRNSPYVVSARPLDDVGVRVVVDALGHPRNGFESLFVRGRVLVLGGNDYSLGSVGAGGGGSFDGVHYLSPERLREARLVSVGPNGEPAKLGPVQGGLPSVWRRYTPLPVFGGLAPGTTDIRHTATAAVGDRDLLVFDLVRTVPAEGRPAPPYRLTVIRVTPDGVKPTENRVEEIQPGFTEPFQAHLVGDDYYFLTRSGVVYRSPPAENGKPRTMAAVWDQPRPRVRLIISDGNRPGVHYLFTRPKDGRWEYFRLEPDPRPHPLAPRDPDEPDRPIELIYDFASELRAKKVLVTPG